MLHDIHWWLRRTAGLKRAGLLRENRRHCGLTAEHLEDRRLLSVVTNLNNSGPGSLRDTLAAAPPGATITFNVAGTIVLTTGELVVDKPVTIDGGSKITIDGNLSSRVMRIQDAVPASFNNVVLKGLTIQNGRTTADGAGILSYEHLTLENVIIQDNKVTGKGNDGGGMSHGSETVEAGNLILRNTIFRRNEALDDAGALDCYNMGDLTITETTFESNVSGDVTGASNQGGYVGPIRVIDALTAAFYGPKTILIDGMKFINNKVVSKTDDFTSQQIGGILISPGKGFYQTWEIAIRNSTITGNTHDVDDPTPGDGYYGLSRGGGLFITDPKTLTIQNSTISDNRTALGIETCNFCRGGGAYLQDIGKLVISDTKFSGNYSYEDGGALMLSNSNVDMNVTLNRVTISGNGKGPTTGTTIAGSGLWAVGFSKGLNKLNVEINDSEFNDNEGLFGSGIMAQQGVDLTIRNSSLSGNNGNRGAGLYVLSPAGLRNNVLLESVTIDGNKSIFGGGGLQVTSAAGYESTVVVRNSTISNNSVPGNDKSPTFGHGGGIHVDSSIVSVEQSTISGNSAVLNGGGIFADYYAKLSLSRSTVTNNTAGGVAPPFAPGNGGGVFADNINSPVPVDNTVIAQNVVLGPGSGPDVDGQPGVTFATNFSFIGTTAGSATVTGAPLTGDAKLLPLGSNGGRTRTHQPQTVSPLINAGDPAVVGGTDQRGFVRVLGGRVDIGAVEGFTDFNDDGKWDCSDMTLLETNIDANTNQAIYDQNGDNALTKADVFAWLIRAGDARFGPGRKFHMGDVNLDGKVDNADVQIITSKLFTNNKMWCQGDMNQDNVTDGQDFNIWNENKGLVSERPGGGGRGPLTTLGAVGSDVPSTFAVKGFQKSDVPATSRTGQAIKGPTGHRESTPQAPPVAIQVMVKEDNSFETRRIDATFAAEQKKAETNVTLATPARSQASFTLTSAREMEKAKAKAAERVFAMLADCIGERRA